MYVHTSVLLLATWEYMYFIDIQPIVMLKQYMYIHTCTRECEYKHLRVQVTAMYQ